MSTKGPKPKAPKAPKASKAAKTLTKAQMVADLADRAGLTKAQVQDVFAALADVVAAELKAGRPATIPGLVKVTLVHKSATPARPGVNPFTKEAIVIKAKPARRVVKVRALKPLKDMA
ncbi:MAG: HU family DNA-binding protein [Elusimicrobiota bacterium]